jgi:hypothetical protein
MSNMYVMDQSYFFYINIHLDYRSVLILVCIDKLRNKEVIKQLFFFKENSKFKGGNSDSFCCKSCHIT